ncbi:PEP-CTERM sorting domain-containing protein [Candidatus Litorirhabdus singularis]|uniref:PEP-CTERM sorting domain-containing protein n=1 Tax=Candidatus Litorirhabdus singularis TaxID=2518993 RepID=UPI00242C0FD1|nr:PEP-CTERM sorting domain-containing protein [Candidatus Litorirhabdus singularis]
MFNTYTGLSSAAPSIDRFSLATAVGLAARFFGDFTPISQDDDTRYLYGWTSSRDCDPLSAAGCLTPPAAFSPEVNITELLDPGAEAAVFATAYKTTLLDEPFGSAGAYFVRDAESVPAPATLTLLGLGLVSLWMNRRKRGAKV